MHWELQQLVPMLSDWLSAVYYIAAMLTICITVWSIMATATVWQEMDETRTQAARHRCAYRERLEFGPFTDRMPEKCVPQTSLYGRLFCTTTHWQNTVNEDSIC